MKRWRAELATNYDAYSFGYAEYALLEADDALADAYAEGYLPYSGSPDAHGVFYMARSARVRLPSLEFTSENRRILKQYDGALVRSEHSPDEFARSEDFFALCLAYFSQAHDQRAMPRERLEHILKDPVLTRIARYEKDGKAVAYILLASDKRMEHYWYSFFDAAYIRKGFGIYLMLDSARAAKEAGREHFYVGTVYGRKALYKANFKNLEWWDGSSWQSDPKNMALRIRAAFDPKHVTDASDVWQGELKRF